MRGPSLIYKYFFNSLHPFQEVIYAHFGMLEKYIFQ